MRWLLAVVALLAGSVLEASGQASKPAPTTSPPVAPIRVDKPITITFFPVPTNPLIPVTFPTPAPPTPNVPITQPFPAPTTPKIPVTFPIPTPTTPNVPVTFPIPTPTNPITTPSTTPPSTPNPATLSKRERERRVAATIQKYMGMHVAVSAVEIDVNAKSVVIRGAIRDTRYEAQLTRMLRNMPELRDHEIILRLDVPR